MRTFLRRTALTVSALALLGAAGGAVAAGEAWAPPEPVSPEPPRVAVPADPVSAVCAGPAALTTGEARGVDPDVDPEDVSARAVTTVLSLPRVGGAGDGADEGDGDAGDAEPGAAGDDGAERGDATEPGEGSYRLLDGTSTDLAAAGDVRAATTTDPAGAGILRIEPVGAAAAALPTGATLTRADAGDLRGLVASPCLPAATTTWLVGGATELGQSAQLTLTNPGSTPAAVDVRLWTSLGVADAPRLTGLTVAPGAQETVLLEATATDPALALRVTAAGGEVTATVQDLRLDGVVPAGAATVAPAAPPARTLTVPGVVLADQPDDGPPPVVRLVNPGDRPAAARVSLLGPDGEQDVPGGEAVVLDPGAVAEVPLTGEPGTYAVAVAADQPLTAAVALTRTGKPGEIDPDTAPVDRAWTAAAAPLTAGVLAVPGLDDLADGATLALTNPGAEPVAAELRPVSADGHLGDPVALTVPAGSTHAVDAADLGDPAAAVLHADGDGVAAAVVLTGKAGDGQLIDALPATADPADARAVRVDVR
ncbi:DUF5719 family protein [Georgenia sp. TF02-10]|uniref:DUF5719 family protein n=1 Tax=Georgenia sp. TF02-10 TaxID=2917725 RepID=UPI001FA75B0F|nr:DUF5719 family protein [Georgenia sp. TF02-10]UNX55768.1 DUF5719 family protein [Georgenia sp. TF02-10]